MKLTNQQTDVQSEASMKPVNNDELEKPARLDPPVVGKVTHSSIELVWDNTILQESNSATAFLSGNLSGTSIGSRAGSRKTKYVVQEEELGGLRTKGFGVVYSGFARRNEFDGLEPRTIYRFRIKACNAAGDGEWSPCVEVMTTKTPMSSDDLHRAVNRDDIDKCKSVMAELNRSLIDAPDKFGYSPLMVSCHKGFKKIAELLLASNADANFQNSSGKNALMVSCYAGRLDIVKLLRKHGAKYEYKDNTGATPLHWAVDGACPEIVHFLLNDGCPEDVKDTTSGWTPLMRCASCNGNMRVAGLLIHKGADVNAHDKDKKSVLMMAALNGHASLVKLLLQKGVAVDARSSHQKTALDFAKSFDHRQIIKMLEDEMEKGKQKREREMKKEIREKDSLVVGSPKKVILEQSAAKVIS